MENHNDLENTSDYEFISFFRTRVMNPETEQLCDNTRNQHATSHVQCSPAILHNSVSLSSDTQPLTNHHDSVYSFGHKKRGCAVLIMNTEFDNEDENLPGVKSDIENMSDLFDSLEFDVIELINLTNEQLVTELTEIQNAVTNDCDCFVCVISTHGGEDPRYYVGDTEAMVTRTEHYILNSRGALWTRHIMDMFNDEQCRALRGKPRLFFIQACRGGGVDKGIDLLEDNGDEIEEDSENHAVFQIPCYNDSLVMFSSTSGKYAWSEDDEGGWLLSALQSVFSRRTDTDLLSLLTQVCGEVANREAYIPANKRAHRSKSAACVYHKLSKDIYFPKSNK